MDVTRAFLQSETPSKHSFKRRREESSPSGEVNIGVYIKYYREPNIAESFLPKNFGVIGKFGDIGIGSILAKNREIA